MVEEKDFTDTAALAAKYKTKTENLNIIINEWNHQLGSWDLGLEASVLIDSSGEYSQYNRDTDQNERCCDRTFLIYGKVDGTFQLGIKEESVKIEPDPHGLGDVEVVDSDATRLIPLVNASRALLSFAKILAVHKMRNLWRSRQLRFLP